MNDDEEELVLARVVADDPGHQDVLLDLRGRGLIEALDAIERAIADGIGGQSVRVLIDPPAGDGRVTLFGPIGRHLLALRKARTLSRLITLDRGEGFWIRVR